jgi:putative ABC transport system permease protein
MRRPIALAHDVRYGARLLRKNPAFTVLSTLVLAIGIGATTAIYSVVDALLVRQLPYRDAERIALLFETDAENPALLEEAAPANAIDWQQQARSFEALAAVEPFGFTYTGGDEPQSFPGMRVTRGFFEVFGVNPILGRTFTPEEFTSGRSQVVVLSYGTWAQGFGADPSIVGRSIRLNGQPQTVIGVMPATFAPRLLVTFNERGIWAPKVWADFEYQVRAAHFYNVVAKLRPGMSWDQAQLELDQIAARLAMQYPRTNSGRAIRLVSLRDHLAGDLRPPLALLAGAALLLLVIAIANAANLLMARAAARGRELAVRSALGASRGRLLRQLLTETLLLTGLGCVLGLVLAQGAARLIASLAPSDIPALGSIGINPRVLVFSCVLTSIVAVLVGLAPAWKSAGIHVSRWLAGAATGDTGGGRSRGRARFVIAELAIALTLLAAGGLLLRSFVGLLATSPGFTPDGVAALQVFVRGNRTPAQRAVFFQDVLAGMKSLPQVREAGMVSVVPFLDTSGGSPTIVGIEGRATPPAGEEPSAVVTVASPGYFSTMRIPLIAGRLFDEYHNADRAPVALVSRTFAQTHWSDRSPIGQRISTRLQGQPINAEIIGVVGDVRHDGLDRPASQEIFVPHAQLPFGDMTFIVRTIGDPSRSLIELKSRIHAVAPNQAVYRMATLPDLVSRSLNERRFVLTLALSFAVLAVGLAATGVYGVMSVVSSQRTREFGLRLALGAAPHEILGMVMRDGALITLSGTAVGLVGAVLAGRLLRGFLFGVSPNDPWTFAAVCGVLGAVAALASLVPALRATRVNPLLALRAE